MHVEVVNVVAIVGFQVDLDRQKMIQDQMSHFISYYIVYCMNRIRVLLMLIVARTFLLLLLYDFVFILIPKVALIVLVPLIAIIIITIGEAGLITYIFLIL